MGGRGEMVSSLGGWFQNKLKGYLTYFHRLQIETCLLRIDNSG